MAENQKSDYAWTVITQLEYRINELQEDITKVKARVKVLEQPTRRNDA